MDRVNPGEEQNERDHKVRGEQTLLRATSATASTATRGGGWFSWELKVLPDQPQELCVTYWGSDAGGRDFDILVDGEKLATERLIGKKPGQFFDQTYLLPESLVRGKTTVVVKFQAHPGNTAGGVFGCAILKRQD